MTGSLEVPTGPGDESDVDAVYDAFTAWCEGEGLTPYPHQEEALLELLSGNHVVLATPTGSGKSLVATGALLASLARGTGTAYYTAPIKALVNEKFFALCQVFGADRVGMLTGDAAVNADAPILCCTAEILAHLALREGDAAGVDLAVMDEFHFYGEPDRGWAWQVPLLELRRTQFLLMSATLGPMDELAADLSRRTGRETAIVADAPRPVPLSFRWSLTPLAETVEQLIEEREVPAYVVHFTQAAAVEHATALRASLGTRSLLDRDGKERLTAALRDVRFGAGFGRTLSTLLRGGIGVHHAGMLPRYRRLVEQLAQQGLLTVVCGTDTLGVGINVPIRTVLFTGLAKFDGSRQRVLRAREFHQIAGRAGRAGFDTLGHVVVQAPEHVIENERLLARAGQDPKKRRRVQKKKPPDGTVVWTEQTFDKLVHGTPEPLPSRMRVDNAMIVDVAAREEDGFAVMKRLLRDNHETPRSQVRLSRRALRLTRSLLRSGVLTRLDEVDEHGRRFVLTVDLPDDFALHQPLSHFALAAFDVLDPEAATYPLDVLSVVEAVLESPRQVLFAQQRKARDEAMQQMKAEGLEYDERLALLDEVTWPRPLADLLEATFALYRETHPWLPEDALEPKSVVREMWEQGMSFTDTVSRYGLARSEGLLLRYLSDAYRTLRRTVPEAHRPPDLEELVEWLGETVRQTDSSLVDEWEALNDPAHVPAYVEHHTAPPPPRALSQQERTLRVMVRTAVFGRVQLAARDDVAGLAAAERAAAERATEHTGEVVEPVMDHDAWDRALAAYYAEHDEIRTDADARGPDLFHVEPGAGTWAVRQTLADPAGDHDWVLEAGVDLAATDAAGEVVLLSQALRRL